MKLQFINDWRKKLQGRAFTFLMVGYLDFPGLRPQFNVCVLGIGITISWSRKGE